MAKGSQHSALSASAGRPGVGHPLAGREGEVKPRLPQAAVLHRERYDADDTGHRAAYDPRMAEFSARHEMGATTWTQRVIARLGTMKALSGRDRLKDALVALFWIGRGDSGPEEWEETKALARQQHDGLVSRYLLGQPDAGEFLTEGLEKMLTFGVD